MNGCTRKPYKHIHQAEKVRDVLNNKPETKHRLYVDYCGQCKAYHVTRGK